MTIYYYKYIDQYQILLVLQLPKCTQLGRKKSRFTITPINK